MKIGYVIALIYAHATKDERMWKETVEALAEDEWKKGHDVLATDIRDAAQGKLHTASAVDPPSYVELSKVEEYPSCEPKGSGCERDDTKEE